MTGVSSQTVSAPPDGDWLRGKLMDWCKKRGFAPASMDDLFAIVGEARLGTAMNARALMDAVERNQEAESMETSLRVLRAMKTRLDAEISRIEGLLNFQQTDETRVVAAACLTVLNRVRGVA